MNRTKIFSCCFLFQVLQVLLLFQYWISNILIIISIISFKVWGLKIFLMEGVLILGGIFVRGGKHPVTIFVGGGKHYITWHVDNKSLDLWFLKQNQSKIWILICQVLLMIWFGQLFWMFQFFYLSLINFFVFVLLPASAGRVL